MPVSYTPRRAEAQIRAERMKDPEFAAFDKWTQDEIVSRLMRTQQPTVLEQIKETAQAIGEQGIDWRQAAKAAAPQIAGTLAGGAVGSLTGMPTVGAALGATGMEALAQATGYNAPSEENLWMAAMTPPGAKAVAAAPRRALLATRAGKVAAQAGGGEELAAMKGVPSLGKAGPLYDLRDQMIANSPAGAALKRLPALDSAYAKEYMKTVGPGGTLFKSGIGAEEVQAIEKAVMVDQPVSALELKNLMDRLGEQVYNPSAKHLYGALWQDLRSEAKANPRLAPLVKVWEQANAARDVEVFNRDFAKAITSHGVVLDAGQIVGMKPNNIIKFLDKKITDLEARTYPSGVKMSDLKEARKAVVELAKITVPPSKGTMEYTARRLGAAAAGAAIGGGVAGAVGAAIGAMVPEISGRVLQSVLMTGPGRRLLLNMAKGHKATFGRVNMQDLLQAVAPLVERAAEQ